MWKQSRDFDPNKAGKAAGWCLRNVRLGYAISNKYLTAIAAWNNTQQHRDRNIPSGVEVPLFYTYKSAGHINVRLTDGRVWSDGYYYSDLSAYERTHPSVHYLGWGESVNNVRVINYVPDVINNGRVGKTVYLSPKVSSWRVYVPGTSKVKATLNPKKFGGLSYIIRAEGSKPNRVQIDTRDFGRVELPIDGDATIK